MIPSDREIGGIVESLDKLYELVAELKKVNRRLLSNMYMSAEELGSYIKEQKLYFHYVKNVCLNIWRPERDFFRLYFYIADFEQYKFISPLQKVVCDVFYQQENDKTLAMISALEREGFAQYARFSKYSKRVEEITPYQGMRSIVPRREPGFFEMLKRNFDVYTDYIPEDAVAEELLDSQRCYSCVDDKGDLLGGVVVSVKGTVATEEFLFVDPKARGRKISADLRQFWHSHLGQSLNQYLAWVDDNNVVSWTLLLNAGYKKENARKLTMLKG